MKCFKILILTIVVLFSKSSFAQTANINEGCFPLTVQFSAPTGMGTWYWDFKDGATSNLENPSNTFIAAGSYIVEFRATATGPILGTVIIDVYPKPVAQFTTNLTQGCAPLIVNFTDATILNSGINIVNYTWIFGDGQSASGNPISHTYIPEGNYSVTLQLGTNLISCDATDNYVNLISLTNPPSPIITTNPSPASACVAPLGVTFSANSSTASGAPLTYNWNFGNSNTSTVVNPPIQNYLTQGNFLVSLMVTDTNGCARSTQLNVGIGQPTANFEASDTICLGIPDTMVNLSPSGNYLWDFGPNATPSLSTQTNPIVTFNTTGIHPIKLSILGPCPHDTTINIFVEEANANFISSPTYACYDPLVVNFTPTTTSGATYLWTFHDGTTSTLQNPADTLIVLDTTEYSINGPNMAFNYFLTTLTITTAAGCVDSYMVIDTIYEPNALMIPDIVDGCLPLTVQFSDSSNSNEPIVNWEWFFGDGNSVSATNNNPQSHTYTNMGIYHAYLVITNSAGCVDTSYNTTIKVGDVMIPDFSVDLTSVCPGDSVEFTDLTPSPLGDSIDTWHYSTEADRMFSCYQESGPKWSFNNQTGPQNVTLTVGFNGCFSSITKLGLIDVKGPIAEINYFQTCDSSFNINFADSSHSATSISWDFGDGNSSNVSDTNYLYAATGDYTVILEAINAGSGCPISYDTSIVKIRDIQASFGFDSLICQNVGAPFNASSSQDVNGFCNMGYTWSFSDPGTRPITTGNANESISFPVTGQNLVTLVVTDVNGCKDTASTFVEVFGIKAGFSIDDNSICIPTLVTFSDSSTSDTTITNWQWSFGDGQNYTGQDTAHTYTANQTSFIVTLNITNAIGCTDQVTKTISVYTPFSTVNTSPILTNICSGDSISFTATDFTTQGSNLIFNWDFMDGNTSVIQNPTHSFNNGGNYPVSLVFEEVSSGCKDSLITIVNVQDYPIASYTTTDTSSFRCLTNPVVNFHDSTISTSPYTVTWIFGDGSMPITNNPNPVWGYSTKGTYNAQLIAETSFGCKDTFEREFDIIGPEGTFSISDSMVCLNDLVLFTLNTDTVDVGTYTWDFSDGTDTTDVDSINHGYSYHPSSGSFLAKLILYNADSTCSSTDVATIFVQPVIADFVRNLNDIDTAICFAPYPFSNTSVNASSYLWDFGDGQTSTVNQPVTHNYTTHGTYQVILSIHNSQFDCRDTIIKTVILDSLPDITISTDTICAGTTGQLNTLNPNLLYSYLWNPAAMVVNPNQHSTATQTLSTTTLFTVTVKDISTVLQCENTASATLYVIEKLLLNDFDTLVVMGDTVYLPLSFNTDLYNFTWTPEEGLSCLDCIPPYINPTEDIIYHLTVSDKFGCFTSEADYDIKVHPETFVKLPTTFTPNGDGVNDIIYLKGWGIKELLEFKIFNRWGELVFETEDINVGWNGYYKGVLQNNDIYVYKVMVKNWKEEEQTLEGHINLMR
ncbi:MAG: mannosidase [Flavobacteriales bacterium]|nr:MAG: mannosidase [Flavobacteriales bacterium]